MAAYNLSSFAGAGAQFFDDDGAPLTGGKVYTYAAGTTTPLATYTTSTGSVANTNPIILDAAGRTPDEIWLAVGTLYKFIVKTSTDVLVGTYDGLPAINDPYSINALLGSITGTNAIAAVATPAITAYVAGATYSFIAANTNTGAVTISISGLAAKSITKNGSAALAAGDIQAGKLTWIEYDGTTFQLLNNVVYGGSVTNATITGGTMTSTTLTGVTLTSLSAPLGVAYGGTGQSTYTDGQLLIGNTTGNTLAKATLTAGSNITVTNGSGTITIAAVVDVTNVTAALANLTAGNVGTFAFMSTGGAAVTLGSTYAGSSLKYSGVFGNAGSSGNGDIVYTAGAVSTGTWRALGTNGATNVTGTLFVRIS
jgi:hypothetical protein